MKTLKKNYDDEMNISNLQPGKRPIRNFINGKIDKLRNKDDFVYNTANRFQLRST